MEQTITQAPPAVEYCGNNGYIKFAGIHLIIEIWQGKHLDDAKKIEQILREAIDACGATLLYMYLHDFGTGSGITGVGVLSESHLSIHSWPEYEYAALDLFVCGTKDPYKALPVLQKGFGGQIQVTELKRGVMPQ